MIAAPSILLAADDKAVREPLAVYLNSQNFRICLARDRKSITWALDVKKPEAVILDVALPDGAGLDICADLRMQGVQVPIILLAPQNQDIDRIMAFETGADDCMGKPINPRELAARLRSLLRQSRNTRRTRQPAHIYRSMGLTIEPGTREVFTVDRRKIDLTGAEFDLLHVLVAHSGEILHRDQLLTLTQGRVAGPFERSVDVLISRVRQKLAQLGVGQAITTVRNRGYSFATAVEILSLAPSAPNPAA